MKMVEAYKCEFCQTRARVYASKSACKTHEERCFHNPETRSCATCSSHRFGEIEFKPGHVRGVRVCAKNPDQELTLPRCDDWAPVSDKVVCLRLMAAFGMALPEDEGKSQ